MIDSTCLGESMHVGAKNLNSREGNFGMIEQYFLRGLVVAVAMSGFATVAGAADPQRTTATYSDWLVQCRSYKAPGAAADKKKKKVSAEKTICEMVQTFTFRRSGRQLAKLAIGQLPGKTDIKAVVQTPLAVYLPDGVVMKAGEKGREKEYKGKFVRCTKTSCFAEIDLKKADVNSIKKAKKAAMQFTNSARRKLSLSVSLRGYGDAFKAALAKSK